MRRLCFLLAVMFGLLAGRAPAQTLTPVEVATYPLDLAGPIYYALDLGYFKRVGLDIHLQTFTNVADGAIAMAAGTVNVGTANVLTLAQAKSRGLDFRFFTPMAVFNQSAPPTEMLAVLKDSAIHTAADLNDKTVAVAGIKSLLQIATVSWVDKHGGNGSSIKFVELSFAQMEAALQAHRVDAVVFSEPFGTAAKADTRMIGSPDEGIAPQYMVIGGFATDAWLNANPAVAQRFATAIRDAAAWGNTHHKESAEIMSKYSKIPVATMNETNRATYGTTLDAKLIQPAIDVSVQYGALDHRLQAADLLWTPPAR